MRSCTSLYAHALVLASCIAICHAFRPFAPPLTRRLPTCNLASASSSSIDDVTKERAAEDPLFAEFMRGADSKKTWKGTYDILGRRGQVPKTEYSIKDVVNIVVTALGCNDDPQLDHGACTALSFRSPGGPLADASLDPASYGSFLRSNEYCALLDYKSYELAGDPIELKDSLSVKQQVNINGWVTGNSPGAKIFDVYLTKVSDQWLLDVILLRKG